MWRRERCEEHGREMRGGARGKAVGLSSVGQVGRTSLWTEGVFVSQWAGAHGWLEGTSVLVPMAAGCGIRRRRRWRAGLAMR